MKTESYYHELGATAGYTLILGVGTNALPRSRLTLIGDAWFSSFKAATATIYKAMEGTYQVKSNLGRCPKDFIEDLLEDVPGGNTHCHL